MLPEQLVRSLTRDGGRGELHYQAAPEEKVSLLDQVAQRGTELPIHLEASSTYPGWWLSLYKIFRVYRTTNRGHTTILNACFQFTKYGRIATQEQFLKL